MNQIPGLIKTKLAFILFITLFCFSCAVGIKRMNNLSLGMTKEEVKSAVGDNFIIRGGVVNRFSQSVEVWEYDVRKRRSITDSERYWLYMVDGKLVQWGKAGSNWANEAVRLNDVQFPTSTQTP
jgi:hypothetical protein